MCYIIQFESQCLRQITTEAQSVIGNDIKINNLKLSLNWLYDNDALITDSKQYESFADYKGRVGVIASVISLLILYCK